MLWFAIGVLSKRLRQYAGRMAFIYGDLAWQYHIRASENGAGLSSGATAVLQFDGAVRTYLASRFTWDMTNPDLTHVHTTPWLHDIHRHREPDDQ